MNEEAKKARNAYKREWAKKNRDKVRGYMERYWNKKAEQYEQAQRPEAQPAK